MGSPIQRVPPQDTNAERSVLGAMMQGDSKAVAEAIKILGIGDGFYRERHTQIFQACVKLFEKSEPVDLITVTKALEKMGELEKVGGMPYLDEIIDSCPTSANVAYYAKMVYDEHLRRKLIYTGSKIANEAFDPTEDIGNLLAQAQKEMLAIGNDSYKTELNPIRHDLKATFQRLQDLYSNVGGTIGLPSGFSDLDTMTSGFQKSDYIIVAGRPSMGKSTFIQNIAQYLSFEVKMKCVIFSLEMSKQQVILRILASEGGVSLERLRTGKLKETDWPKVTVAAGHISEGILIIDDATDNTPMKIRAKCYSIAAQYGLDAILIDHIQLMHDDKRAENRNQEITEISRGLKGIGRDLQVPVIAVSQLSREIEKRANKRPLLSDLRESGSLEQDADLVLFLYRPDYYDRTLHDNLTELIIGKQRNGPVGDIELVFDKQYAKFRSKYHGDLPGIAE
jgi:replicative DNA helicase